VIWAGSARFPRIALGREGEQFANDVSACPGFYPSVMGPAGDAPSGVGTAVICVGAAAFAK